MVRVMYTFTGRSFSRGCLAIALAASTLGLLSTPANAATGHLTPPAPGVLFDDCRDVAVPYALSIEPGADSWSMTVTAYGPDGTEETSDFLYDDEDPSTGTAKLQFCGYEDPGSYIVRAEGSSSDFDAKISERPFNLAPVTLTMRLPESRTTVKVKRVRNGVRVTALVRDERPNGFFPTEYATLNLQYLSRGQWRNIPGGKVDTDENGRFSTTMERPSRPVKIRALTRTSSRYTSSKSRPVTVR